MITARPTPGNQYRVVWGDRLDFIEKEAYGSIKGVIEAANPFLAKRQISLENRPIIYNGDILTIPIIPELRKIRTSISGKDKNQLTIIIGDREIRYESARAARTMDTCADACNFKIPWTPGKDKKLDNLLKPFTYPDAQVFIGNELIISGALYGISPDVSTSGTIITGEIYSYTVDLIDSTMPKPYEANNITLKERANQLIKNFGIKSVFDFEDSAKFERVTADRTDTVFNHLSSLAAQRGFLISSTPSGDLLFTKAKTNQKPVGTIESGKQGAFSWGANFDGRKKFNSITAIGESPGNPSRQSTVIDSNVPKSRFMAFAADETTDGNIETAAAWKKSKINAESLTIPFPVAGWYAPDKTLYKENTLITIKSPEIFCPDGFTFLISQVEYVSEESGQTSTLQLLPPSVYNNDIDIIFPWETL